MQHKQMQKIHTHAPGQNLLYSRFHCITPDILWDIIPEADSEHILLLAKHILSCLLCKFSTRSVICRMWLTDSKQQYTECSRDEEAIRNGVGLVTSSYCDKSKETSVPNTFVHVLQEGLWYHVSFRNCKCVQNGSKSSIFSQPFFASFSIEIA